MQYISQAQFMRKHNISMYFFNKFLDEGYLDVVDININGKIRKWKVADKDYDFLKFYV